MFLHYEHTHTHTLQFILTQSHIHHDNHYGAKWDTTENSPPDKIDYFLLFLLKSCPVCSCMGNLLCGLFLRMRSTGGNRKVCHINAGNGRRRQATLVLEYASFSRPEKCFESVLGCSEWTVASGCHHFFLSWTHIYWKTRSGISVTK